MCDLENRVDVVQVSLPKPEDLDRVGVQSREVDVGLTRAKQKMVIILKDFIPRPLEYNFAYSTIRGITVLIVWVSELCQLSVELGVNARWSYPMAQDVPDIPATISNPSENFLEKAYLGSFDFSDLMVVDGDGQSVPTDSRCSSSEP